MTFLAQRRTLARLLIIGTYRPDAVLLREHPLRTIRQELQQRGDCMEVPLALLSQAGVTAYLAAQFPGQPSPATLVSWLYQHTDGHPLFLTTLVHALVEQEVHTMPHGDWTFSEQHELERKVLKSLRQVLEQQLLRLLPRRNAFWKWPGSWEWSSQRLW